MKDKSCGNCVNVSKFMHDGKETWCCEEYGFFFLGVPADVTPPHDGPCGLWTDNQKKKNTWEKFV